VSLISSLSRAVGLWEPTALSTAAPPGSITVGELGPLLFETWLRGGAWDEARAEPELLRAAVDQRDSSPCRALREVVLDALLDLGEEGWLPYSAFERFVSDDPRVEGLDRLLRRWAERTNVITFGAAAPGFPPSVIDVVRRIVLESLPILGIVDLGDESRAGFPAVAARSGAPDQRREGESGDERVTALADQASRATLRLTQRGRLLISRARAPGGPQAQRASSSATAAALTPSKFLDGHVLRIGAASIVGHVLSLGLLTEIGRVEESVDLVLSPAALSRAISAGALGEEIRERIEAVASLPDSLSQILHQASTVVGKGTLALSSAFLWIEDSDVREMLRTRRSTADLFVDPSPPGGLLVHAHIELERLVRRCRGLGVEVELSEDATSGMRQAIRVMTPRPTSVAELTGTGRSMTPAPSAAARRMTPNPRSKTPFPRTR
jgi:hypothetical protein